MNEITYFSLVGLLSSRSSTRVVVRRFWPEVVEGETFFLFEIFLMDFKLETNVVVCWIFDEEERDVVCEERS